MAFPPVMKLTLTGQNNETYIGTLFLRNWTSNQNEPYMGSVKDFNRTNRKHDPTGATYYVIAVVLVYGMSIVLLIASHINRKHSKELEDRQINKYLQEFQVGPTLIYCIHIFIHQQVTVQ